MSLVVVLGSFVESGLSRGLEGSGELSRKGRLLALSREDIPEDPKSQKRVRNRSGDTAVGEGGFGKGGSLGGGEELRDEAALGGENPATFHELDVRETQGPEKDFEDPSVDVAVETVNKKTLELKGGALVQREVRSAGRNRGFRRAVEVNDVPGGIKGGEEGLGSLAVLVLNLPEVGSQELDDREQRNGLEGEGVMLGTANADLVLAHETEGAANEKADQGVKR
jgi:hypothetical protein